MRYFAGLRHDIGDPAGVAFAERVTAWFASHGIASRVSRPDPTLTLVIARKSNADNDDFGPESVTRSGDLVLAGDLELYNRDELESWLNQRGEATNRLSDMGVVALYLRIRGIEAIGHLAGDFALVAFDAVRRRLTLIRDHLGCRPAYYANASGRVGFATTAAALAVGGQIEAVPHLRSLIWHLVQLNPGPGRSYVEGIGSFEAGHMATWDEGAAARISAYWRPELREPGNDGFDAVVDRVEEVVRKAVLQRLPPAAPLGMTLSGGLDSSLVVAIAARSGRAENMRAFTTARLDDPLSEEDERQEATAVAESLGLAGISLVTGADSPVTAGMLESARLALAPMRQWHFYQGASLQKVARTSGVRHLLTGYGGDQAISLIFAYAYRGYALSGRFGRAWRFLRARGVPPADAINRLLRGAISGLGLTAAIRSRDSRARSRFQNFAVDPVHLADPGLLDELFYTFDLMDRPANTARDQLLRNFAGLVRKNLADMETELPYFTGVELRNPFYDWRIFDCLSAVQNDHFILPGRNRRIIRELLRRAGLPEVANRQDKKSFAPSHLPKLRGDAPLLDAEIDSVSGDETWRRLFPQPSILDAASGGPWTVELEMRMFRRLVPASIAIFLKAKGL